MHSFQLLHPVPSSSLTLQFLKHGGGGVYILYGEIPRFSASIFLIKGCHLFGEGGETWHCIWLTQGEEEVISMEQALPYKENSF